MLIKIIRNYKDYFEGKPHASDVSRRDFLKSGLELGGIALTAPVWLSIFRSDKALADAITDAAKTLPWSFTAEENKGGAGYSNVYGVNLADRQTLLLENTKSLGIRTNQTFRSDLIAGLAFNNRDAYLPTLLAGGAYNLPIVDDNGNVERMVAGQAFMTAQTVMELVSKTSGFRISCPKNDDTTGNPANPLELVQKLRIGSMIKTVSAGRSRIINDKIGGGKNLSLVSGNDVAQLIASTNVANGFLNNDKFGASLTKAVKGLNIQQAENQKGRLGIMELQRGIASALDTTVQKFDPSLSERALNPLDPSNAGSVNSYIRYDALTDREKLIFASLLANARGIAGSCYIGNTGYDYHNNFRDGADLKHAEMARVDLLWMAAQAIAGKPGFKYRFTDGGIAWTDRDVPLANADRGSAGMGICMAYNPAGRVNLRNVGSFIAPTAGRAGEAADRAHFVAKAPQNEPICALVNWATLAGIPAAVTKGLVTADVRADTDYQSLLAVG